ncbi:hypothetical protein DFH09DRAFT_1102069 [Mycena vulgaris]|nr:hypothetical protein DFH09DRAFT_1102069 [Mycena vulgaris]
MYRSHPRGVPDAFPPRPIARAVDENAARKIEASLKPGILANAQNKLYHCTARNLQRQSKAAQKGLTLDLADFQERRRQGGGEGSLQADKDLETCVRFSPTSPVFSSLNAVGSTSAVNPAVSLVFQCLSLPSSVFSHAMWSTPAVIAPSAEPSIRYPRYVPNYETVFGLVNLNTLVPTQTLAYGENNAASFAQHHNVGAAGWGPTIMDELLSSSFLSESGGDEPSPFQDLRTREDSEYGLEKAHNDRENLGIAPAEVGRENFDQAFQYGRCIAGGLGPRDSANRRVSVDGDEHAVDYRRVNEGWCKNTLLCVVGHEKMLEEVA